MNMQPIGAVASKVVDRWTWWRNALAGNFGPIHHEPEQGYFRVRGKDGQWEAVAIWQDETTGEWLAYRAGREVKDVPQIWTFACRYPIEFEAYEKAMAGEPFDDEPPAPTIGDNSGEFDPFEALRIELAGEKDTAAAFLKSPVKTQADADRIGIWSKRVSEIAKRAEGQRVSEKEPHLAASRAVDSKWRTVIDDAKEFTATLKKHVEAFLIAEKRKAEEVARKAREEAERLARVARESEDADARAALTKQAQEAERAAETRNASAGRTGARVSVRTVKVGVVTDYPKAAAALIAIKHPDLLECIHTLAQRAARSGMAFDGMEIREEEKIV